MIFLFTTSNLPASALIRWGLEEPVSHFAIGFTNGVVCHQRFTGFELDWWPNFQKKNLIVNQLDPKEQSVEEDARCLRLIAGKYAGTKYDIPGISYWSWRVLLKKTLNKPIPPTNKWGKDPLAVCTELGKEIYDNFPQYFSQKPVSFDITSPHQLYLNMLKSGAFIQSA